MHAQGMEKPTHSVDLYHPVSIDRIAGQQFISELRHRQRG